MVDKLIFETISLNKFFVLERKKTWRWLWQPTTTRKFKCKIILGINLLVYLSIVSHKHYKLYLFMQIA